MELQLTEAQEAKLGVIAEQQGISVRELLEDAAETVIQLDAYQWEAVDRSLAQADRGELIDHEEVVAHMNSWLSKS